jgi:glycosyltransferase involved in cell wall biosynthesis
MELSDRLIPLNVVYLLVSHIPIYEESDGSIWIDELWHKDLVAHFPYISKLSLLAPFESMSRVGQIAGQRLKRLDSDDRLTVVPVPSQRTRIAALVNFPRTVIATFRAARDSQIVHIGVLGWPYPIGWLAGLAARHYRRKLVVVIESAAWRQHLNRNNSLLTRTSGRLKEFAAKYFGRSADFLIATQSHYVESLGGAKGAEYSHVHPATWIEKDDIVSVEDARRRWDDRLLSNDNTLRLLYAGRLSAEKGVLLLSEVADLLKDAGVSVRIDAVGDGELKEQLMSRTVKGRETGLHLLETRSYGREFFQLVAQYDAVVVPSLSDEQPRVVFDAYSQAVAVIASDTPGLRACVDSGKTGWHFRCGDAASLFATIAEIASNKSQTRERGLGGLSVAIEYTHEAMHRRRWQALVRRFPWSVSGSETR